jgi:hypothetical protein
MVERHDRVKLLTSRQPEIREWQEGAKDKIYPCRDKI